MGEQYQNLSHRKGLHHGSLNLVNQIIHLTLSLLSFDMLVNINSSATISLSLYLMVFLRLFDALLVDISIYAIATLVENKYLFSY